MPNKHIEVMHRRNHGGTVVFRAGNQNQQTSVGWRHYVAGVP